MSFPGWKRGPTRSGLRSPAARPLVSPQPPARAQYSDRELEKIASTMYNIGIVRSCNIFDGRGLPICPGWNDLPTSERRSSVEGLKQRIERETLPGYFARKRREQPHGAQIYNDTVRELQRQGLM